jgi:sulfate adenylyltransferase subunit 2
MLLAQSEHVQSEGKPVIREQVRFRTVGDMTCTAAVRSSAATVDEVIEELARTRISERGATRVDDRYSEAGMEDRKRIGYF